MPERTDTPDSYARILFEGSSADPFLVVYKPSGMPSAPLRAGEGGSALEYAAERFQQISAVRGKKEVEGGLLHRLDTDTEGLLLIALDQKSYDALEQDQADGRFIKYYRALCLKNILLPEGFPPVPADITLPETSFPFFLSSKFRPYGTGRRQVRPVCVSSEAFITPSERKKAGLQTYITEIASCGRISAYDEKAAVYRLEYVLKKGFRHQLRCHSAWLGLPIIGDRLYMNDSGSAYSSAEKGNLVSGTYMSGGTLCLTAWKIEFPHPRTGLPVVFSL